MEFREQLRKWREAKKLSLRKLDELSGVSHVYLSQIEIGNRGVPSPDVLKKLADPLGVSYRELMRAAGYLGEDTLSTPTLDEEWPEVASVLRGAGKKMTPEDRRRIARIVKAAIPDYDE